MNIQLKLSASQLETITGFLENEIGSTTPTTNAEKIVQCLMIKLYKKLKAKCIVLEQRSYTMSIEPEVALAFIDFVLPVTLDRKSYEGNLVQTVLNNFHKQTI